jgi:diphosphomevalonate decarboxylase
MPFGSDPYAFELIKPDVCPWGMVIVVIDDENKEIGSTEGMELSRKTSPYFKEWVRQAKKDYRDLMKAAKNLDFSETGRITEENALAMHACMVATRPPLVYWNPTTLEIMNMVKKWRMGGLEAYATVDAGHNVALLGRLADLDIIAKEVKNSPGVSEAWPCLPAGGAEVLVTE